MHMFLLLTTLAITCSLSSATDSEKFLTISGRAIDIQHVRKHLPFITQEVLRHVIFEHDYHDQLSNHDGYSIAIEKIAPNKLRLADRPLLSLTRNGVSTQSSLDGPVLRFGNDFTFVHDSQTDELIAAWGPRFELRLVHPDLYPGVFVNSWVGHGLPKRQVALHEIHNNIFQVIRDPLKAISESPVRGRGIRPTSSQPSRLHDVSVKQRKSGGKTSQNFQCSDHEIVTFEMAFAYDSSFCALFGGEFRKAEQILYSMVHTIAKEFLEKTCVQLKIITVDAYCDTPFDVFAQSVSLRRCFASSKCDASATMLQHVRDALGRSVSATAHRDAFLFFSGYDVGSSMVGASYKSAACNEDLSFAWIGRSWPIVLAHEIGHMLGATHGPNGIMRAMLRADDPLVLSRRSVRSIRKFVEKDPRSWCLRREFGSYPVIQKEFSWSSPTHFMFDQPRVRVSDITFAALSGTNRSDVIALISEDRINGSSLSLSVVEKVKCSQNGSCTYPTPSPPREIAASISPKASSFGIAFGSIVRPSSKDIVISHVEKGLEGFRAYYQLGIGLRSKTYRIDSFSDIFTVPDWTAPNVQCSGLTLANIRSARSNDLVLIHVEKRRTGNIARYKLGFDIGTDGYAKGGWSKNFDVFGWYGERTTGVSASIYDIDGNGKKDIIIYHMDNSTTIQAGFFRVGHDLNEDGLVTGGWTEYIRAPKVFELENRLAGSSAISDLGGDKPIVALLQRESFLFTERWQMYMGSDVISKEFVEGAVPRDIRADLSEGCLDCYSGRQTEHCLNHFTSCPSNIDEVFLAPGENSGDEQSVRMSMRRGRELPGRPKKNSLFCVGFHYLYVNRNGCDVFDKELVLAKGVEQGFLDSLAEESGEEMPRYESTSLYEQTYGQAMQRGAGLVVASIEIIEQDVRNSQIIQRAIAKVSDFSDWPDVFETAIEAIVKKRPNRYVVTFRFNEKYTETFQ